MDRAKRILNVYATRYGSTRIVAKEIEACLSERGFAVATVELLKRGTPPDPALYDGIVAGSGIAMFMWIGRMKRFLKHLKRDASPLVVYICSGTALESPDKARDKFLNPVISRLKRTPSYAEVIEPVMDFRPDGGLPGGIVKKIEPIIQAMAGDRFEKDSLMDLRDKDHFDRFLEHTIEVFLQE